MELSLILAQQIAAMFLIAVLGFISVKAHVVTVEDTRLLSRVVLYVVCPCVIYYSFQMDFSWDKLTGFGVAMLAAVVIHGIYLLLNQVTRRVFHETPVESASLLYTNSLNLIIPLVAATLGSDWLFYAAAYCAVQTGLVWSHGYILISESKKIHWKNIFNVNIIAIILGLTSFLLGIRVPAIPSAAMENLGNTVGPLSMLIMGMLVAGMDLKKTFTNGRAYLISLLRLLFYPFVAMLFLKYSGMLSLHEEAEQIFIVTMMAAASCSASTLTQMAQVCEKNGEYACTINIITLALCIVTMPTLIYIYQVL